jgi:hypothetical protein
MMSIRKRKALICRRALPDALLIRRILEASNGTLVRVSKWGFGLAQR